MRAVWKHCVARCEAAWRCLREGLNRFFRAVADEPEYAEAIAAFVVSLARFWIRSNPLARFLQECAEILAHLMRRQHDFTRPDPYGPEGYWA